MNALSVDVMVFGKVSNWLCSFITKTATIIIMNLIILHFCVQIATLLLKVMVVDKIMDKNELNNIKRNLVAILPKYAGCQSIS